MNERFKVKFYVHCMRLVFLIGVGLVSMDEIRMSVVGMYAI